MSIGRLDITTAVMTMSGYRANPREGHLQRVKRIVGYLQKFRHAALRFRTKCPDYSTLPPQHYDWDATPYGNVKEELPDDLPVPLGNPVITTTWVDANLYHDFLTGRSVTGVLHMINQTFLDWFSKKQNTVETSTYGSEFVATRMATEQIMDIRMTLRYMGIPVHRSVMFGDNESVVTSSTLPHSPLTKRWTALSYHRVREAIAAGVYSFWHCPGVANASDILSKHWGHAKVWPLLQPMLFWQGDTAPLIAASA